MDGHGDQPPPQGMQHPPHVHMHPMYAYPMDPSWGGPHGPMMPHHMQAMHGYHHHMHPGGMDGLSLPPGIPGLGASMDPLEAVLGPFPCARLRGLPFDATLEDVLVFFQGLVVLDVVLQGTGEAFVIFANPMDFQMALQRDRQSIGRRYVEVFQGKRSEYYAAIAAQHWQIEQHEQHVMSGEEGAELQETSEGLSLWSTGPTQTQSSQRVPMEGVRNKGQGVPQAGRGGGRGTTPSGGHQPRRTGGGIQVGEHTGYLRMRGLPFSSSKEEIASFFEGYNVVVDSIVLTYRSDGRATGEGYIQFESPEDAKNAMLLHRNTMGSRYIELFISNKEEHARAFARFSDR